MDQTIQDITSLYELKSIDFDQNHIEATIKATTLSLMKCIRVDESTGKYQLGKNLAGTTYVEAKMVKEDVFWKLERALEVSPLTVWRNGEESDPNSLQGTVLDRVKSSTESNAEAKACLEAIQKNEAILSTQYDTYQEARAAVDSMDLEHGNYYALAKACSVSLATYRNAV